LRKTVELTKAHRLQRELMDRQRRRKEVLRPFYDRLTTTQARFDFKVVPAFVSIVGTPSMKQFWESDDAVLDSASSNAAVPSLLDEMATSIEITKYMCYRAAVLKDTVPYWGNADLSSAPPAAEMDRALGLATSVVASY
jgi:hypothetical protein